MTCVGQIDDWVWAKKMATLLLDGQNVYSKVLLKMGFEFKYKKIDEYLN